MQKLIAFLVIMSMSIAVTGQAADDTVEFRYGGHTYLIVKQAATWQEAKSAATNAHGHLVIINSAAENSFLFNQLNQAGITTTASDGGGARYVWLGGSDIAKEGEWRWYDGSLISAGYSNWGHGGEPDNYQNRQDCLAMGLDAWPVGYGFMGSPAEWNDINGDNRLAYIIEIDSVSKPKSGTLLIISGPQGDSGNNPG